MIWPNKSARDYQQIMNFGYTYAGTSPFYVRDGNGLTLTFTWGQAYSMGVSGWQANLLNKPAVPQYNSNFESPWGSGDVGPTGGILGSGYIRVYVADAVLSVDSGCNATFSFSSLNVWVSFGGAETLLFTTGAHSISFSGYDERLNCTSLNGYVTVTDEIPPGLICGTPTGTWFDLVGWSGGYKWSPDHGVTWFEDDILLDSSGTPGICSCFTSLPSLSGSNSYNVSGSAGVNYSVVQGPIHSGVLCPPAVVTFSWWDLNSYWTQTAESVSIKSKYSNVPSQLFQNSWNCYPTPGSPTSGSMSVPSFPSVVTCASVRNVITNNQLEAGCFTPHGVPPGWVACWPVGYSSCQFRAGASISWPNLPPCNPPTTLQIDNCHDEVSGMIFSARCDTTKINLVRYNFADVDDTFTAFTGTCSHPGISIAANGLLFIFFDDGTTTYLIESTNYGQTWSSPVSIATGTWPKPCVDPLPNAEFVAIYDGANYNCWRMLNGESVFTEVGMIVTAPAGQGGMTVRRSVLGELVFEVSNGSGAVLRLIGTNMGVNWTLT